MPRPRLAMRKVRDILRLALGEGLSRRQVGASRAFPFTTVADHVRRANEAGLSWPLPDDLDDAALEALLFPKGPAPAKVRPPAGLALRPPRAAAQGRDPHAVVARVQRAPPRRLRLQPVLPPLPGLQRHVDVVMRQEHRAGEKLFVDFPGQTIPIYDRRTGEVVIESRAVRGRARGLELPLRRGPSPPRSCRTGSRPTSTPSSSSGPCPAIVVLRQPALGGDPSPPLRARRQRHLPGDGRPLRGGHHPDPAPTSPATRPRSKPACCLAERWILARLRNRRFYSLAEANAAIGELRGESSTTGPSRRWTARGASSSKSSTVRPCGPLPAEPLRVRHLEAGLKVNIDYHVERRPPLLLGALPTGRPAGRRADGSEDRRGLLLVRAGGLPPAQLRRRWHHTTDPAHMPESHRRHAEWTPGRIVAWAERTGPATAALVDGDHGRPAPSRAGLPLRARHHPPGRPLRGQPGRGGLRPGAAPSGRFSYRSVESILQATASTASPCPRPVRSVPIPGTDNVRGPNYYR